MGASRVGRGTTLQGEYVLRELIGERNGHVWRAQRRRDGAMVVVRLFSELPSDARALLIDVATRASRVRHPGLAAISTCGSDGEAVFIVEEHVEGRALAELCERSGIPPIARAAELALQLCRAIECAHRHGVAHDALCPSHVLLPGSVTDTAQPLRAKLIALGVPASARAWPPVLTTALYMAPEQLAPLRIGRGPGPTSATMNVYSLGALLYDLVSGGPPFPASSIDELAEAHATGRVMPPSRINPQVPITLDTLLLRTLNADPEQRYASVSELIEALSSLRLSTGNSGVQPVGVFFSPDSVHAPARPERATWNGGFDERPTIKSELPPLLPLPEGIRPARPGSQRPSVAGPDSVRPSPRRSSAPPIPSAAARNADQTTRTPLPAAEPRVAPATIMPPPIMPLAPRPSFYALQRARANRASIALTMAGVACLGLLWFASTRTGPQEQVRSIPLAPLSAAESKAEPRVPRDVSVPSRPLATTPQSTLAGSAGLAVLSNAREQRPARSTNVGHHASRLADNGVRISADATLRVRPVEAPPDEPALRPASTATSESREPTADDDDEPKTKPVADPQAESEPRPTSARAAPSALPTIDVSGVAPLPVTPRGLPAPLPAPLPKSTKPSTAKARPLHARIVNLTVRGSLPSSLVEQGIARVVPQLNECVRKAGVGATQAIQVAFEIDEQGRARNPRVRGAGSTALQACVAAAAGRIASRRAPDTGTVVAGFALELVP